MTPSILFLNPLTSNWRILDLVVSLVGTGCEMCISGGRRQVQAPHKIAIPVINGYACGTFEVFPATVVTPHTILKPFELMSVNSTSFSSGVPFYSCY